MGGGGGGGWRGQLIVYSQVSFLQGVGGGGGGVEGTTHSI